MSYSNENPEIYEEFSQKYKFSIKVLNSIKEISLLKEKYGDSNKNSYSSVIDFLSLTLMINYHYLEHS